MHTEAVARKRAGWAGILGANDKGANAFKLLARRQVAAYAAVGAELPLDGKALEQREAADEGRNEHAGWGFIKLPLSGSISPAITRSSVVFPEPLRDRWPWWTR